jgi:tRNA/tmRNA/rRNA uracil-C5-methylase (TrmA/RlmC/RlmD family)
VGAVAHGGHCVARYEGRVVFVRHALPGETVRARITEATARSSFWRADAVEVLTASPDRVQPPCPFAGPGRCGGCDWQHATLAAQRELKAAVIDEQLRRLAGLEPGQDGVPQVLVEAVPQAEESGDGLGWRTRVRFTVDERGRAGLRRHRSHDVVPVDRCLIADPKITELELGRQRWPGAAAVEAVAPSGDGDPLVVVEAAPPTADRRVRTSARADSVVASPVGGSASAGAIRPKQRGRDKPSDGRNQDNGRNQDGGRNRQTSVGKSDAARLKLPRLPVPVSIATRDDAGVHQVRGRTWVSEQVLVAGQVRPFRISGTGFWQVHPAAAQTLLDAVLAAADARPGERAVDLYGGAGLFAAGLADRVGVTGSVIAVESDPRAVKDARRSLHDLEQIRFEVGPVERMLPQLSGPSERPGPLSGGADVVVLDPPRSGAGRVVIEQIVALSPRVIVYVACDPAALARDLATAAAAGYRLAGLRAFDLFPMTHHVECVATLVPSNELS